MHGLLKELKNEFFPLGVTCDICGRETFGANLCTNCVKTLVYNDRETCPVCGRATVHSVTCIECKDKPPRFKRAVSAFLYEGSAVDLIKKFKSGAGYLKEFFADRIFLKLKNFPTFDCIVCVPMTRRAKKKRDYNQSELLGKAVAARTGLPFIKNAIAKIKKTGEQKFLTRKERSKNLAGCFAVIKKEEVKGKRVLVVDDVLTTGATADEITKILLKSGAETVYLATVASVAYKIK